MLNREADPPFFCRSLFQSINFFQYSSGSGITLTTVPRSQKDDERYRAQKIDHNFCLFIISGTPKAAVDSRKHQHGQENSCNFNMTSSIKRVSVRNDRVLNNGCLLSDDSVPSPNPLEHRRDVVATQSTVQT